MRVHPSQGQTYLARGLPPPPPRATFRSVVFGQRLVHHLFVLAGSTWPNKTQPKLPPAQPRHNARFLEERATRTGTDVENHFDVSLLRACFFSKTMRSTGQPCSIGSARPLVSICLSSKDVFSILAQPKFADFWRIQDYLRALTTQIPLVEQCEALYQLLG